MNTETNLVFESGDSYIYVETADDSFRLKVTRVFVGEPEEMAELELVMTYFNGNDELVIKGLNSSIVVSADNYETATYSFVAYNGKDTKKVIFTRVTDSEMLEKLASNLPTQ